MSTLPQVIKSAELMGPADVDILKKSKFKGFTDDEIRYCSKVSQTLNLSPFLNQIHFVRRKNKDGTYSVAAQVGIDGFRLAAQRAGGYAGSDDAVFEYDARDTGHTRPIKATVTVWRMVDGQRCPFTASARWSEFYNPQGGMWDKLPHQMIGKTAEAQALRKAFPAELSGIHTPEEMDQASAPTKAQDIEAKIVEAEGEPAPAEPAPSNNALVCPTCSGKRAMVSKYHENTGYCVDCKKTFALT